MHKLEQNTLHLNVNNEEYISPMRVCECVFVSGSMSCDGLVTCDRRVYSTSHPGNAVDGQTDGQMVEQVDRWITRWIHSKMDGCTDG